MAEEINIGPLSGVQLGTAELHVGSIYLIAGITITTATTAVLGTEKGGTANLRLRSFDTGDLVLTLSVTGLGLYEATLGSPASIVSAGYYDLFIYGDAISTVTVVKGLKLIVE